MEPQLNSAAGIGPPPPYSLETPPKRSPGTPRTEQEVVQPQTQCHRCRVRQASTGGQQMGPKFRVDEQQGENYADTNKVHSQWQRMMNRFFRPLKQHYSEHVAWRRRKGWKGKDGVWTYTSITADSADDPKWKVKVIVKARPECWDDMAHKMAEYTASKNLRWLAVELPNGWRCYSPMDQAMIDQANSDPDKRTTESVFPFHLANERGIRNPFKLNRNKDHANH
ncbi:hypothetical protein M426DRAFT_324535 [Hypoxylon sp. CI-4A]|nr:hypothetical protein M426DRAFT_324535 [Hypoxylon sp. CI-4A]